jgi:hypothetical protein
MSSVAMVRDALHGLAHATEMGTEQREGHVFALAPAYAWALFGKWVECLVRKEPEPGSGP